MNPDHIRYWRGTLASVERIAPDVVRVKRLEGRLWWKRTVTLDFRYSSLLDQYVHVESGIVLGLAPAGVWYSFQAAMENV